MRSPKPQRHAMHAVKAKVTAPLPEFLT